MVVDAESRNQTRTRRGPPPFHGAPGTGDPLNRSTQHFLEVYSQEFEILELTGAVARLAIDAVVDIDKIDDVVHVGRPVHSMGGASSVFKLTEEGGEAVRVTVKFGRVSVQNIEVVEGLKVGDRIILSDTSAWDGAEKIRLK